MPVDAPMRNYKDRSHKPELMYALTSFEALCGFRPTAVTVVNDLAAVGALAGALEAGAAVPAELAVAGYDDTFFSAIPQVSLTTVNPGNAQIGATAAERLLRRIGEPGAEAGTELIPPRLVVRASTSRRPGEGRDG